MDEVAFLNNEQGQDAVIRNIEIIGEAANNIQRVAPQFAAQHDDVPWQVMYTMRNRVSHGYDKVDLEVVWRTIQSDLPGLQRGLERKLRDHLKIVDSIGTSQHLTSIKVTGTISAPGNNGKASIFQIADFRLVGDQFKIIAELKQALGSWCLSGCTQAA